MSRSPVAFVTANTFEFDSRHRRATEALVADGFDVTVVAMAGPGLPAEEHWPSGVKVRRPPVDRRILSAVPRLLRGSASRLLDLPVDAERLPPAGAGPSGRSQAILRRGLEIAAFSRRIRPWADAAVEAAPAARIWVAKALVAIPVAAGAASQTGGLYVYDIADLHIESGRLAALPGPLKSWLRRREAGWVHGAAGRLTVTPAMAAHIAELYDVPPPTVVLNVREPWRPGEPAPELATLHRAAGLAPERRVVLYQGAFRPDQGIELLLAALDAPPLRGRDVVAVFLGFGPLEDRLRRAALERPGRIVLLPPVPSEELLAFTAGADVAFVGTPPATVNQTLTTPNKLFEAVMAGIPVIVAGGTWTATLVADEGLGSVVEPWTAASIAASIATLLDASPEERLRRRRAIRTVALGRLNWDVERDRLLDVFRALA